MSRVLVPRTDDNRVGQAHRLDELGALIGRGRRALAGNRRPEAVEHQPYFIPSRVRAAQSAHVVADAPNADVFDVYGEREVGAGAP
jgi:hypothetical protein